MYFLNRFAFRPHTSSSDYFEALKKFPTARIRAGKKHLKDYMTAQKSNVTKPQQTGICLI